MLHPSAPLSTAEQGRRDRVFGNDAHGVCFFTKYFRALQDAEQEERVVKHFGSY